eukprot:CAMPEP_0171234214 /NCGR_PEP_ID=MMETSP0790-20130122/41316_1 /TAXON_ID=2925 /ORGANISM="Alexandrium catenella, Strain OF101" /LENGTH=86 /DNA_ID=CAMNT_0011700489 /DNA_START=1 /DNA_END=261 /DNA_ORIENTATION=+
MAVNKKKMQELEEKRKAASDAAEAAKRTLLEHRQKEKTAMEATRKALEEAKALKVQAAQAAKGKRNSVGDLPPAKRAAKADGEEAA